MPLSHLTNGDLTQQDGEDSTSEEEFVAEPVEEKSEVIARNSSCVASAANQSKKSPRSRNDEAELFKGAFQPRSAVFGFPKPNTPQLAPSSSLPPQSPFAQGEIGEHYRRKTKKKAMKGVLAAAVIEDRLEL
jgi:hypothetical protein